eukprot:gene12361-8844_t
MRLFALFCVTLAVVLATFASAKKAKAALNHDDVIKQVYKSARSAKKASTKANAIHADPKAAAAHVKNLRRSSKQAKFSASSMIDTFADISTMGAQPAKTRTSYARSGMLATLIFPAGDVDCSGDTSFIHAVAGNECIPGRHNESLPNEKAVSHLFMMRKNRDAVSYTDVTFSHSDRDCVVVDSASTEQLYADMMGMCAPMSMDPNGQHVLMGLADRSEIAAYTPGEMGVRIRSFQSSKGCKSGAEDELVEYIHFAGSYCQSEETESTRYTCNGNNEPMIVTYSDNACGTQVGSEVITGDPLQGCTRSREFTRIECVGTDTA